MAAHNLIVRFKAKLDAQNAKLDALRWVIGVGLAVLGILITAGRLLG